MHSFKPFSWRTRWVYAMFLVFPLRRECFSSFISFSRSVRLYFLPFNYLVVFILITAMLLIKKLCLDSCLPSHMIHSNHCPLLGNQMFPSVSGRASIAVGTDREWFLSMFQAGDYKIQNRKKHIHTEVGTSFTTGHRRISYGEIMIATNEFSDANLLGVGSFGKVYKGTLNDGTMVAIKLLNLENEGAHKCFEKECKVLGKVKHRNLIKIITSYSDLQMKALIFPLMLNGSLEKWLYPNGQEESNLSLFQRLNIAIDIAQGVAYLHHYCFVQVLHCDLKPSNVLLGEDMTAYLTDFGIATICFANSKDSEIISTHALKGSIGYIPPEYGLGGHATTKGDVYSYGIMLLEMLTRKKPTHSIFVEGMNLHKWVGSSFLNRVKDVVDGSLLKTSMSSIECKELNCLSQLISVGLLCTKESPEGRPTMIDIVGILQSIKETFLGATEITKFQSEISHLLGSTSATHNNIGKGQSSSLF